MFFILFLVVLMFVTTIATSLYLYFQAFCQVRPLIARKIKSCDMLSRKQIMSPWHKNAPKITRSYFWSEFFWQYALYNWLSGICSEFFDLSCGSIPNNFFNACWPVFHSFCLVLPLISFANLKLAFSLQKLFSN